MCQDVRGALKNWSRRQLGQMFKRADGRRMPADDAMNLLLDELAKGHEVIPIGPACKGFDYSGGGCPGHDSHD